MLPTKNFKNQCLSLLFIAVIKLMINNLGREGLIWLKNYSPQRREANNLGGSYRRLSRPREIERTFPRISGLPHQLRPRSNAFIKSVPL